MDADRYAPPAELAALRSKAAIVAGLGVAGCALAWITDATQFFRSYLVAWLLWLGVALGCLAIAMLHQLTRGSWGLMIRRILGAASRTLPLMLLLFLPIMLFGIEDIFSWARPEAANDPVIQHKAAYLNVKWFIIRSLAYFALWLLPSLALNRLSRRQDSERSDTLFRRMQFVAAPALLAYCLAATFASVDWLMSLDPHWYSSLFGVSFIGGHGVSAFAFVIPMALWLGRRPPLEGLIKRHHFHDYGKLLFAFTMLWAYFSVSQLIIIWSGNLPEEVTFYLTRLKGGWKWASIALAVGHFLLPFLVLLSRDVKRDGRRLAWMAILLLAMRWLDLYWTAMPAMQHGAGEHGVPLGWIDLATVAGVGGVWFLAFLRQLGSRPLLPVEEPYLKEALEEAA